jgi:hypothetical protein
MYIQEPQQPSKFKNVVSTHNSSLSLSLSLSPPGEAEAETAAIFHIITDRTHQRK